MFFFSNLINFYFRGDQYFRVLQNLEKFEKSVGDGLCILITWYTNPVTGITKYLANIYLLKGNNRITLTYFTHFSNLAFNISKSSTPSWVVSRFLNCKNDTTSCNASHIGYIQEQFCPASVFPYFFHQFTSKVQS